MSKFKVEINISEGVIDFIDGLENIQKKRILHRNDVFERLSINQLKKSKDLEKIEGCTEDLWELKYRTKPPFRMISAIEKNQINGLIMFKGSGSTEIKKYLKKVINKFY